MSPVRWLSLSALALFCHVALVGEDVNPLFRAIRNNDLAFLEKHLDKTNVSSRDDHAATLLMHAAAFGSAGAIRILLAAGADVNARNAFDATALLWAARD